MSTFTEALDALDAAEHPVVATTYAALEHDATGTMRDWMDARHGRFIKTIQWEHDPDTGRMTSVWTPGTRIVDAHRATYVSLDGSRRDYRGARVLAASPDSLVASVKFGRRIQTMVFTDTDDPANWDGRN